MKDRIHAFLDGELSRDELAGTDGAELGAYDEVIRGTLAALHQDRSPDLTQKVMRRIEELPERAPARGRSPGFLRRALDRLWAPRLVTVQLRPAYGLAAAAMLALLLITDPLGWTGPAPMAGDPAAPQVFVHFRLDAPRAAEVRLAGDFTGWKPAYALHETAPGVWSVVVPLDPGVHDYAFVVDGERWLPDPLAPQVDDGFGGTNSRLAVLTPEARRS